MSCAYRPLIIECNRLIMRHLKQNNVYVHGHKIIIIDERRKKAEDETKTLIK